MPYPARSELPDAIKDSLPSDAQEIWRNAFNSAEKQFPGDEERANKVAWAAVKNAGWAKEGDKWVKKNMAKTHEFDTEIFSVGKFNGDNYTQADIEDMVTNFNALASTIKPPLKFGHNEKSKANQHDGQPALGWVKALKVVGSKIVATFTQVPKIVHDAIKAGLYKRVSSEIYWDYEHAGKTFKRVLAGVALLGADIPAVSDLADLEAFLSQTPNTGSFGKLAAYSFATVDFKIAEDVQGIKNQDGGTSMTPEKDVRELSEKLDNAKDDLLKSHNTLNEKEAEINEKAKQLSESEAKIKKYEDAEQDRVKKEAKDLKKTRTEDLKSFCENQVKAFKLTPAARDAIVGSLDEGKHSYSEDTGYGISLDTLKKVFELQGKILDPEEKGHGKNRDNRSAEYSAQDEVDKKVKKYMTDNKVEYVDAMRAVLDENPDLADEYIGGSGGGNE